MDVFAAFLAEEVRSTVLAFFGAAPAFLAAGVPATLFFTAFFADFFAVFFTVFLDGFFAAFLEAFPATRFARYRT